MVVEYRVRLLTVTETQLRVLYFCVCTVKCEQIGNTVVRMCDLRMMDTVFDAQSLSAAVRLLLSL